MPFALRSSLAEHAVALPRVQVGGAPSQGKDTAHAHCQEYHFYHLCHQWQPHKATKLNLPVSRSARRTSVLLNPVAPTCNYFDAVKKFGAQYCFFCSDPCEPKNSAICIHCGAIICIALDVGAAGCIGAKTVNADRSKFECPVCIGSKKTDTTVIPYYLSGSGLRRTPKIAWPLLLLAVQLKNLDSLVLRLVAFTMQSNYELEKENVRFP
jgi:hypothetical protein